MKKELPRFLLDMLSACPRSGAGVHSWLFNVSRQLWAHRTRDEIVATLATAGSDCGRHISNREIEAAVDRAKDCAWAPTKRTGFAPTPAASKTWPCVDAKARAAITLDGPGLPDLWEASPVRVEENRTEELIDLLFPGDPLLCCGWSSSNFHTQTREEWRGQLAAFQLIVPSPMAKPTGTKKSGPGESSHTLDNTGPRRFLVVEFDTGTPNDHAAILLHLASCAPLVLAVHSGGKSLHGWFYCANQSEFNLRCFMEKAVALGADHATWTRSQFVRMPSGTRDNGRPQATYFFNPEPIEKGDAQHP